MAAVKRRPLQVASRRVVQDAKLAIRDVYDAIVELVTNADDRYQILGTEGRVEIELGRQGKGKPSILRVRDFADGMTTEQMNRKLGRIGGRVSGMEEGKAVRGMNSRGAKDIAALGKVTFESIAGDGRAHTCRIFPNLEYEADDSRRVAPRLRKRLGIGEGTGTVATIEVDPIHRIPKIDTLVPKVATLVRLRDIVWQKKTELVVMGLKNDSRRTVSLHRPAGRKRISTTFDVPGHPGAKAKLLVFRARKQFKSGRDRFRLGGILVKSRHAIHEATLFDRGLEWDSNALWFHGRLTCEAIDDLWNEYDERQARGAPHPPENPVPILDPSRKSGLTPGHPFVDALYGRALGLLRPLVERGAHACGAGTGSQRREPEDAEAAGCAREGGEPVHGELLRRGHVPPPQGQADGEPVPDPGLRSEPAVRAVRAGPVVRVLADGAGRGVSGDRRG